MDKVKSVSDVQSWVLLSSSIALDEKWFSVRKDVVRLPSGKVVDDYFVWESPHIVQTIPVTSEGAFVLVRQYRHAIAKIAYQFPAGAVDPGETPEAAASRELEEETGYRTNRLIRLGSGAPYSTKLTGYEDFYLARDAAPTGQQHYDEQEETNVVLMSQNELLALLDSGKPQQMDLFAATFLALRYLEKHPTSDKVKS